MPEHIPGYDYWKLAEPGGREAICPKCEAEFTEFLVDPDTGETYPDLCPTCKREEGEGMGESYVNQIADLITEHVDVVKS